jgi:transposase
MPRCRTAYPPEFPRQMGDLVRSGRTPEELAREFEPTAQSISTWMKQAERDAGKRVKSPGRERYRKGVARRQVCNRKTNTRELPFKCRKCSNEIESGE